MNNNYVIYMAILFGILVFIYLYKKYSKQEDFAGSVAVNAEAIGNVAAIIKTGNLAVTNATVTGKITANDISANTLAISGTGKISGPTYVGNDFYVGDKKVFSKNGNKLMVNWANDYSEGTQFISPVTIDQLNLNKINADLYIGPYIYEIGTGRGTNDSPRGNLSCLDSNNIFTSCNPSSKSQQWFYNPINGHLMSNDTGKCLTYKKDHSGFEMTQCGNDVNQSFYTFEDKLRWQNGDCLDGGRGGIFHNTCNDNYKQKLNIYPP